MEPSNWAPEHSDALREFFALRLSCSEAAAAINRKFNTAYSRNAVLGRARRMGLTGPSGRSGRRTWRRYVHAELDRLGETPPD